MGQLVLLMMDLSQGFDFDRLLPLGSKREIEARIRKAVGPRPALRFTIGDGEVVTEIGVELSAQPDDAFPPLRRLCDQTGWSVFDRESGRFLDLTLNTPLNPPAAAAPPFHWWTRLPPSARVAIGLATGLLLLGSLIVDWVWTWDH